MKRALSLVIVLLFACDVMGRGISDLLDIHEDDMDDYEDIAFVEDQRVYVWVTGCWHQEPFRDVMRDVYCVEYFNGSAVILDDEHCPEAKPKTYMMCPKHAKDGTCILGMQEEHKNYAYWHINSWGECSNNVTARGVDCRMCHGINERVAANPKHCLRQGHLKLTQPTGRRDCDRSFSWQVSNWTECFQRGGELLKERHVFCVQQVNATKRRIVHDRECVRHNKPAHEEACSVKWSANEWGACQNDCKQHRHVNCVAINANKSEQPVYWEHCSQIPRLPRQQGCGSYVWNATDCLQLCNSTYYVRSASACPQTMSDKTRAEVSLHKTSSSQDINGSMIDGSSSVPAGSSAYNRNMNLAGMNLAVDDGTTDSGSPGTVGIIVICSVVGGVIVLSIAVAFIVVAITSKRRVVLQNEDARNPGIEVYSTPAESVKQP